MERQPTDGIFGLKGDRLYGCQCYYGPPDKVHVHVLGQVVEILGVTLMGREQAGPEKADIQKSTVSEAVSNSPAPVSCVLTCPVREGLERISDRRMWHRLNGELTWRGQTADGNEIEVEDPRDIARMALAAPCLGPPAAPHTVPIAYRVVYDEEGQPYLWQGQVMPGGVKWEPLGRVEIYGQPAGPPAAPSEAGIEAAKELRDVAIEAARWRYVRQHGHVTMSEDGDLYLGVRVADDAFLDHPREAAPWLTAKERHDLLGDREDSPGVVSGSALERAIDTKRGAPPPEGQG